MRAIFIQGAHLRAGGGRAPGCRARFPAGHCPGEPGLSGHHPTALLGGIFGPISQLKTQRLGAGGLKGHLVAMRRNGVGSGGVKIHLGGGARYISDLLLHPTFWEGALLSAPPRDGQPLHTLPDLHLLPWTQYIRMTHSPLLSPVHFLSAASLCQHFQPPGLAAHLQLISNPASCCSLFRRGSTGNWVLQRPAPCYCDCHTSHTLSHLPPDWLGARHPSRPEIE